MIRRRMRGNTMALYAAFLVTVGMPLLALGVDGSRVMVMKVRLRDATEAACQAYANSLDIRKFQLEDQLVFTEGYPNAYKVFSQALRGQGSFGVVEERRPGEAVPIGAGKSVETIVIRCFGNASIKAIIPLIGNYIISTTASAKTKFTTMGLP